MKKIYLIIALLLISATSQAQEENIFGMYFKFRLSKEGRYNFNTCKNEIIGVLSLMEFNPDSSFDSRVFSLSETCTFNAGRCDTTYGVFSYLEDNIIVLNTDIEDTRRKIGSRDCNHFSEVKFYLFKNKISDLPDEYENQFNNYHKLIDNNNDKDKYILDLETFYSVDTSDSRKEVIAKYEGLYYKFEVDKTGEGKVGVFKLLKLNEDKTFEYKFFQVYTNKVLKLDNTTYLKGSYERISQDIIKLNKPQ